MIHLFQRVVKEGSMKRVMKVLGIVILVTVVVVAALVVKGYIQSKKPSVREDYYTEFSSPCPLEQKCSQPGGYAVSSVDTPSDDKRIGKIRVWYPSEATDTDALYPAILVVNASNTPAYKYEGWFKRLASWGFVVIGNEDPQAGTGETASITLDYILNLPKDNTLYGRIDEDRIGIVGFSQGGAGALAAVSEYENGSTYKAIFTGSAAYQFMAGNFGWHYDVRKIHIPYFMAAGTGSSDDNGKADPTKEYAGVAPLSSLVENYNSLPDSVAKVRGRATGAEHEDMLARSDGYMTAWMLYQLMDDPEAAKVFVGGDAEILHNEYWQDVEKNL